MSTATAIAPDARAVIEHLPALSLIEHLPPLSLSEINASAARQTRIDRKYVVPTALVGRALTAGAAGARVLEIDGRRNFSYASRYFDTSERASFYSSGQGRRRRFKVRTRSYVEAGTHVLEVKTRGARGTTVKERMTIPHWELDALDGAAAQFVDQTLARHRVDASAHELTPVVHTGYRRTTLALGADRVTIDTALAWSDPSGAQTHGVEGVAVIETKSGSAPTAMDRALWRLGQRPIKVSKFGVASLCLDPTLPDLRWHRVLARHLTTPTTTKEVN